ncbi:MAG: hypothetical protein IKX83_04890, partial [Clostridia bacterium]|nr:hypothetical protein [Clostridia bacterium]
HVGRVKTPFFHQQADLLWKKVFDPNITLYNFSRDCPRGGLKNPFRKTQIRPPAGLKIIDFSGVTS